MAIVPTSNTLTPFVITMVLAYLVSLAKTVNASLNLAYHDSMADPTFPARFSTANNMLNNTVTNLFQQYTAAKNAGSGLSNQNSGLQGEVVQLGAKLAAIKKEADTYDREFLDRSADRKPRGFFSSRGISTFQDWILLIFYIAYGAICASLVIYAIGRPGGTFQEAFTVLLVSVVVGVMMSAVILRFV